MNNPVGILKCIHNPNVVIMLAISVRQIKTAKAARTKHINPSIFRSELRTFFAGLFMPPPYASSPPPLSRVNRDGGAGK
ncbi:MAG: hypothetical protein WCH99_12905 [Verrucomicrobiota bacterium]